MQQLFEKYKGQEIKNEYYNGFICGYSENRLLVTTETNPVPSFRRLDKDTFVADEFKSSTYRYIYIDERTVEKILKI